MTSLRKSLARRPSTQLPRRLNRVKCLFAGVVISTVAIPSLATERRAAPPKFSNGQNNNIFFPKLSDGIRGQRPSISSIRKAGSAAAATTKSAAATSDDSGGSASGWKKLISPTSIEDEVKRVKLEFDKTVSTPGAFKSGGYQDARLHLSVLSTMFAVINDYNGEVRWKNQAAAARDLISRTAFNCKAGSTQVFNEAKLRKADLQDLVSGGGLAARDAETANDWTMIVDRSPLMEYCELLLEQIEDATNNPNDIKADPDQVKRLAELFAVLGQVLIQEGLDDYDDEDYAVLSKAMSKAGVQARDALDRGDIDAVQKAVGAISQSCANCHEQYR